MKNLSKCNLSARRLALEILVKVDQRTSFANSAIEEGFKRKKLEARDRAFVTALVFGVIRNRLTLDKTIAGLSSRPIEKLPKVLTNILRLGIFQLDCMDDIPPSAVLFTSVELAKMVGHIGLSRFANGLLRTYLSSKVASEAKTIDDIASDKEIDYQDKATTDLNVLADTYSMPEWMVKRWSERYGLKQTIALLRYYKSTPDLVLRICPNATSIDDFKSILGQGQIDYKIGGLVTSCFIIKRGNKAISPQNIAGFNEGVFTIQDEPSAFVAVVTDPKPGELIIDLCAAPGGKSLHLAELMHNTGQVIAVDRADRRFKWLRDNRGRFRLTNLQLVVADGRTFSFPKLADRVLVDAPCSGTGVLNRRPDLRYRLNPSDIDQLVSLQRELLNNAAKLVKPGGILVYSTCSIEPEENIDNVKWFLANHKHFQVVDITSYIPGETLQQWLGAEANEQRKETIKAQVEQGYIQLLPSSHGTSGFFIAKMQVNSND